MVNLPNARTYVLFFVLLSAIKHNYWAWPITLAPMEPTTAILLSLINYTFDSINTALYLCVNTSPTEGIQERITPTIIAGGMIFILGAGIETLSEKKSRNFKIRESNDGKLYTGGLFQLARHINFTGFALYKGGMTILSGGWIAGAFIAGNHLVDFAWRAIPVLSTYFSQKVTRFSPAFSMLSR